MANRLPSLNALRAFECSARHRSLSLASAELNVTHAAVSRHIRELEGWLGTKLFIRTGRGVELTEDGKLLKGDLTPVFERLAEAVSRFNPPGQRRALVISAEVPFATLWLVPRLGGFTSQYPDIDLIVDANDRLVDLNKGEADLGIRYGKGKWRDVETAKLIESEVTPVCSPALLKQHAIIAPHDLEGAMLIQDDTKDDWRGWLAAAGVEIEPSGPLLKGHLAVAAAEAGQGFALVDGVMAGDAVLAGRLTCPFPIVVRHHAYYLVKGADTKEGKAAAQFRAWLLKEIAHAAPALSAVHAKPKPATKTSGGKRR